MLSPHQFCYLCKYLSFIQRSSQNPFLSAGPRHIIRKSAPLNLVLVPRIMALYKFTYLLLTYIDENSVRCMCDCVGVIGGSNTMMDSCRSNIGGADPCHPCYIGAYHKSMRHYRNETMFGWLSRRRCFTSVSFTSRTFLTATCS